MLNNICLNSFQIVILNYVYLYFIIDLSCFHTSEILDEGSSDSGDDAGGSGDDEDDDEDEDVAAGDGI